MGATSRLCRHHGGVRDGCEREARRQGQKQRLSLGSASCHHVDDSVLDGLDYRAMFELIAAVDFSQLHFKRRIF